MELREYTNTTKCEYHQPYFPVTTPPKFRLEFLASPQDVSISKQAMSDTFYRLGLTCADNNVETIGRGIVDIKATIPTGLRKFDMAADSRNIARYNYKIVEDIENYDKIRKMAARAAEIREKNLTFVNYSNVSSERRTDVYDGIIGWISTVADIVGAIGNGRVDPEALIAMISDRLQNNLKKEENRIVSDIDDFQFVASEEERVTPSDPNSEMMHRYLGAIAYKCHSEIHDVQDKKQTTHYSLLRVEQWNFQFSTQEGIDDVYNQLG